MKKSTRLFTILLAVIVLFASFPVPTEAATSKKASINATIRTIYVGDSYTLKLTGTTIKSVKSSNKKVATVSKKGVVKAKKKGTATITLKGQNGKSYKCKVTVRKSSKKFDGYDQWGNGYVLNSNNQKVYSCKFPVDLYDLDEKYLDPDTEEKLNGFFYKEGNVKKLKKAENEGLKKFGNYCVMHPIGIYNGKTIWFQSMGKKPAEIKLNKTTTTLAVGKKTTLKISGTKKTVTWKSSDETIATVSSKGKVTAKGVGVAVIRATVGGKDYDCQVIVKKTHINAKKRTIYVGKTYTLKLNGTEIKSVKSSNKKVATVSKSGKVTAKKAGTATITLTGKDGKAYKCKVTVKKAKKKYEGYDEFGNGYVLDKWGAKVFDCKCPYELYTITTWNGQEGWFAYNDDRDEAYEQEHYDEYHEMIAVLCEKYDAIHGSKGVGKYTDTSYIVWQGYSSPKSLEE